MRKRDKRILTERGIIGLALLFAVLWWFADAVIDSLFFYDGPFWEIAFKDVTTFEFYFRSIGAVAIILFGWGLAAALSRTRDAERALREVKPDYLLLMDDRRVPRLNFIIIAVAIIIVEAAVMTVLASLEEMTFWMHLLADCAILTAVLLPTLHLLFFRPLVVEATERRRAIRMLQESETHYRNLTEHSRDLIWKCGTDGRLSYVNGAWERLLGYSTDEMVGRPLTDFQPEAAVARDDQAGFATPERTLTGYETTLCAKDGREVEIVASVVPWCDDQGRIIGAQGTGTDITRRKRAETVLRENEERFRRQYEFAPLGYQSLDADGHLLDVNPAWLKVLGYDREEVIGRSFSDFLVDESRAVFPERFARFRRAGEVHGVQFTMRHKTGRRVDVEFNGRVAYTVDGEFMQSHCIMTDITARKAEEAERRRLFAAIEQSAESIVITDADAKITYVNPAFEKITGYTKSEVLGQKPSILQSGEHDEAFYKDLWATLSRGESWWGEFVNRAKDGSQFSEQASISAMRDSDGTVVGYIATKRDVTESRAFERALREMVETTSSVTGVAFFRHLARCLSQAVGVRYVIIGQLVPGNRDSVRSLAAWADGAFMENLEYDLKGTPCENVTARELCYYPSDIQELFPDDSMLREINAQCYLGVPLVGADGQVAGIMAILHDDAIANSDQAKALLSLFSVRAAAELDRVRTEEKLRRSHMVLERTQQIARIGSWEWNIGQDRFTLSDELLRIAGVERASLPECVTLDSLVGLFPAAEALRVRSYVETVAAGRDCRPLDAELRRPDGRQIALRFEAELITGEQGEPALVSGMAQDITAEKVTLDTLRENQMRLQMSLDAVNAGSWVWECATHESIWDGRTQEIFGFEIGAFMGTTEEWAERVHPDDLGSVHAAMADAIANASRYESEYRIRGQDGEWRTVREDAIVVRDEQGNALRMIGMCVDVTDRRNAEQLIRENEARYRTLFESSGDANFICVPGGEEGFKFAVCNDRACELFGYTREELTGRSPWIIFPERQPDGQRSVDAAIDRVAATMAGKTQQFEWLHLRKDNTNVLTEVTLSRVNLGNGVLGFQAIVRDISERKRSERIQTVVRDLGLDLTGMMALEDALRRCLEAAIDISGMDAGGVWLRDENTGGLRLIVHQGVREDTAHRAAYFAPDSAHARLIDCGMPVYGDHASLGLLPEESGQFETFVALAAVPLKHEGTVIGTLNVVSRAEAEVPDYARSPIELIATQAASVIARDRAIARLRESEENFRTLADFTYDWEHWRGSDGRYIYVSPSCERITGYRAEEFYENPELTLEIAHADDRELLARHMTMGPNADSPSAIEFRIITRNGEERWIEHRCQAVYSPDGRFLGRRGANRDITARHRAQREVVESRLRLTEAQRLAHLGSWEWNACTNEVKWSEELWRIFGLTPGPASLTPRDYYDRVPREDRIRLKRHLQAALVHNQPYDIIHSIRRQNGELRYIHSRGRVERSVSGNPLRMIGTALDITERRLMENSLRENEARIRAIFEAAGVPILLLDPQEGRIIDFNAAAYTCLGYGRDEFSGLYLCDIEVAETAEAVHGTLAEICEHGGDAFETRFRRRDGKLRDMQVSLRVVPINNRRFILGVCEDITESKHAREALRQSEMNLGTIVRAVQTGIMIVDPETHTIVDANPTAASLIGAPRAQIVGKECYEIICTSQRGHCPITDHGQTINNKECQIVRNDGTEIPVLKTVIPVVLNDREYLLESFVDISERKRMEEELLRAKRLETAGQLAGQIAHDFNNLLGPLMAYPELIGLVIDADDKVREMLNDMERAARQIADINQDLLTLGRRGHYRQEMLDLNTVVDDTLRTISLPSTIAVNRRQGTDLHWIRGGGAQLTRILSNLFINASEAMKGTGQLTLQTENIELANSCGGYATVPPGSYVRIRITDTGCGITDDVLEHIFEPFFTTKKTDKKRGSGLGLSVVHAVMEDHSGYIDVESTVNEGTTFTLYFPAVADTQPANSTTNADELIPSGRGESVLVVDDDPMQLRITFNMLEKLGYQVTTTSSGEEAVEFLRAHPQDIVMLDMVMGGIDGTETLRRIKEINPDQIALLFSGFAANERVDEAMRLGAVDFLPKPVQINQLAVALQKALRTKAESHART